MSVTREVIKIGDEEIRQSGIDSGRSGKERREGTLLDRVNSPQGGQKKFQRKHSGRSCDSCPARLTE